jgi:hypothetical protein
MRTFNCRSSARTSVDFSYHYVAPHWVFWLVFCIVWGPLRKVVPGSRNRWSPGVGPSALTIQDVPVALSDSLKAQPAKGFLDGMQRI